MKYAFAVAGSIRKTGTGWALAPRLGPGVRMGLGAGQSLERLAGRRHVALGSVKEAEHVVEGAVLQHQYDDVIDRRQPVSHCDSPFVRTGLVMRLICDQRATPDTGQACDPRQTRWAPREADMRVTGAATLAAPAGTVRAALGDRDLLARAIPGCERLD